MPASFSVKTKAAQATLSLQVSQRSHLLAIAQRDHRPCEEVELHLEAAHVRTSRPEP